MISGMIYQKQIRLLERVFWKNIKEAEIQNSFEESIEEDGSTRKANLEADLSDKIEKENEEG